LGWLAGRLRVQRNPQPNMNTKILLFVGALAVGYFAAQQLAQYPLLSNAYQTGASLA